MTDPVRLGIIGASPGGGWASAAHLPAVQALEEIDLVAVATTRRESAEAARDLYGARRAYADAGELIADPEVEAVTVAVRVPGHRDLVEQALKAGKHVYCEWPLTADTASAIELRDLAESNGLETIIGFQAARSLPIRHAADIVASGELGALLSATLEITVPFQGETVAQAHAYVMDDANGANLLTISTGHGLDTLCAVAGEITEVSATLGSRYPEATVVETGERIAASSPDQVSVTGTLEGGAVMTAHVQAGVMYEPGFRLKVRGKLGAIYITARPTITYADLTIEQLDAEPINYNYNQFTEKATRRVVAPPDPAAALAGVPSGPPSFVAGLYLDLAAAIRRGERNGPDFAHAVRRHRLLDAIRTASADGTRQRLVADDSPFVADGRHS